MKHIAIFSFRVPGLDADPKWGGMATDSLAAAFTGAGYRALDAAAVRKAVEAAQPDPDDRAAYAAIAQRLGADAFVTGFVIPQARSLVLEVALSGTEAPNSVRSATGLVPVNGLGQALERLVARLVAVTDSARGP